MKSLFRTIIISSVFALLLISCHGSSDQDDSQRLYIGDDIAIASTQYGKVKGFILNDVYTFLGIPYGATTAGEGRFMPPQEPEPWDGILPTVFYGDSAPQKTEGKYSNSYGTFTDHWNYYDVSEDCLRLNVWTPGIADGAKRPVLVWIHGGGFTSGNGIEQDGYNGENLSRDGDIVFVSLNHRLGPIGFTDFSAVDKKYSDSGNVGILDIVAALKWVHANIKEFGGDPANVTIMGQSGGGAKVCTLVAMDETAGLISKAVALSGNITTAIDRSYSSELGKYICKRAGGMESILKMSWKEYIDFANAAAAEFNSKMSNGMMRGSFGPVADGYHIPPGTFYRESASPSNSIPMLFSSTTAERGLSRYNAALEEMDKDKAVKLINQSLNTANGEAIFNAYEKIFPDQKPIDVVNMAVNPRDGVILAANAKAVQDAPVYLAWFGWNPPIFDGRMKAFHCLDICFWFKNTDLMLTHTGGGPRPRALSDKMSAALLAFMRTGCPDTKALPKWTEYTPENGATMTLNDNCELLLNPDKEARQIK